MNSRRILILTCLSAMVLAGCGQSTPQEPVAEMPTGPFSVTKAGTGYGFTVGSPMAARTVYVFFDTQCPHCATLWEASKPFHNRYKFVWMPVGLLNNASTAQGATLLAAQDPASLMDKHEKLLLAKQGGISADVEAKQKMAGRIGYNTKLLLDSGAKSVPFIVFSDVNGNMKSSPGAMSTEMLGTFLESQAQPQ